MNGRGLSRSAVDVAKRTSAQTGQRRHYSGWLMSGKPVVSHQRFVFASYFQT